MAAGLRKTATGNALTDALGEEHAKLLDALAQATEASANL